LFDANFEKKLRQLRKLKRKKKKLVLACHELTCSAENRGMKALQRPEIQLAHSRFKNAFKNLRNWRNLRPNCSLVLVCACAS
jgi:hypothetical protein